jgi:filamentous hemagglutinin family protein
MKPSFFYLLSIVISFIGFGSPANAQVEADNTLGAEKSIVNNNVEIEGLPRTRIDGGAVRGFNLFHSFLDFNVSEQGLFFSTRQDIKINNIVSRVTGGNNSKILGKLGVLGNANLYLINPNGIIFGPSGSLDLRGSFVATTANAIQFGAQGFFDASNPSEVPILTVNPSALLFNRINAAPIVNNANGLVGSRITADPTLLPEDQTLNLYGLRVPDSNSLLLLGGDVTLNGGSLTALGGEIGIGSVSGLGTVELISNGTDLSFKIPDSIDRGNISLLNQSNLDASGQFNVDEGGHGGGTIQIVGNNIQIRDASQIISETTGNDNGQTISINAKGSLQVSGYNTRSTLVSTLTTGPGNAGDIELFTRNFKAEGGGQISTSSAGNGAGGRLKLTALESIDLIGIGEDSSSFYPSGSGLFSIAAASGNGGKIDVFVDGDLIIRDGAVITTNFVGTAPPFEDSSTLVSGKGGDIKIFASNSVKLYGSTSSRYGITEGLPFVSGISTATFGGGAAGNLEITTRNLSLSDANYISAIAVGEALGGNVVVNAEALNVNNGGYINVSSLEGKAGSLKIAANSIALNNGYLVAQTGKSRTGDGANIFLNVSEIIKVENESLVSATAFGTAMGGNITFNTPLLVVLPPIGSEGSDIIAKADKGNGGNISINAKGIFGIKERAASEGNQSNDIDASSDFGSPGQVQLNAETDPSKDIVELPSVVVDPNALVSQTPCKRGSRSEFTRSGRGGLPPSLTQELSHDAAQVNLVEPVVMVNQASHHKGDSPALVQASSKAELKSSNSDPTKLILPAQGWVFNSKGEVVLVASNPSISGTQRLNAVSAGCPVP